MKIAHATLTKGAALTLVSFSVGNLIRLTTSIILRDFCTRTVRGHGPRSFCHASHA